MSRGLRRLAAQPVGRSPADVVNISKLAEGGFNRLTRGLNSTTSGDPLPSKTSTTGTDSLSRSIEAAEGNRPLE
jgi:hypothetical protein